MKNNYKLDQAYKTIGEVAKEIGLINKKTGNLQTHTLRYWETQFKQIKPFIRAGNRRYYSKKDFDLIKNIKFLLKEQGLTINGVKKILSEKKEFSKHKNVLYCDDIASACNNVDLVIIHTEWEEFKALDFNKLCKKNKFKIFDMRNLYSHKLMKQKGFHYFSIGR